jgi:hypothetical protein
MLATTSEERYVGVHGHDDTCAQASWNSAQKFVLKALRDPRPL